MKTAEDYFRERNGGKSAEKMIKDGEFISPVYAIILMKDFADHVETFEQIESKKVAPGDILETILKNVSGVVKIPVSILKSKKRGDPAIGRFFFFKIAKKFTKYSHEKIGSIVGKDHSSVTHGLKVVEEVPQIRDLYEELFEGKKRTRKPDKVVIPSEVTIEAKDMLIGRDRAKVINMISPYKDRESEIVKPYSGYRVHSF